MGCAYPLMFSHVLVAGDPPFKNEPLPHYYQGETYWQYFYKEESWFDDSNIFDNPFVDHDNGWRPHPEGGRGMMKSNL
jgi:hypothetical protein